MSDNNNSDNDSNGRNARERSRPSDPSLRRKPPLSIFIWLLVFAVAGFVLLYSYHDKNYIDWTVSQFENNLKAGNVRSVNIVPEDPPAMQIDGEFINSGAKSPSGKDFYRVRVIYSDRIDDLLLNDKNIVITVGSRDTWFRGIFATMAIIVIPLAILYLLFSRQIKLAGKGAMQFGKSKARMIFPDSNKTKFDDVAGADEAKEETKEIMDYLKDPIKFKLLGGRIPKGALLMGPPGTGKTLLAKAIAGEADVPFFSISGSDFVEMFVGVGASRVRDMFEQARRHSPCLIFIDEIDAVGRSRFSGIGGGHDEREQTLNAMLVEMDGLETQEGVIVLAATNRPDVLDPALLRPGRFDRQIVLDLPDIKGRRQILDVHTKNIKLSPAVDLDIIARGTPGFSGADIANLVNEAALLAARKNKKMADMEEMEEARDKVRWGRERRSKTISERERKLTAYHEAGHTLTSIYCEHASPLHKVTIIPRGIAYLGATMYLPDEDRYTQSKTELEDQLVYSMGGKCAEEIVFKDVTTGAAGDLEQATKIARKMVCAFGMSDKMGPICYGARDEHIYLGREITKTEDYSEDTAREIDVEIKRILSAAHARSTALLNEHRDQLETLAQKLLEIESMDAAQVYELLGIPPRPQHA